MTRWLSRNDLMISGALLLLIAVNGVLLYRDFNRRLTIGRREKIGVVIFKKKQAERKYSGQVIWEDVSQRAVLYNHDTLRTLKDSLSEIHLKDGTELTLSEETLIRLSMDRSGTDIGFLRGNMGATAARGSRVKIASDHSTVSLSHGKVNLAGDGAEETSVSVLEGAAEVENEQGKQTVAQNQVALMNATAATITRPSIKLNTPKPGMMAVSYLDWTRIDFEWSGSSGRCALVLSRQASLDDPVKRKTTSGTTQTVWLQPGTYYWAVRSLDGKQDSMVGKLVLLKDHRCRLRSPAAGYKARMLNKPPLITFSWVKPKYAGSCTLEISRNKGFETTVVKTDTPLNRLSVDTLRPGTYYWRVRGQYGGAIPLQKGGAAVRRLVVRKLDKLAVPRLLRPQAAADVSELRLRRRGVIMNWGNVTGAAAYRLVIARDRDFERHVFRAACPRNVYRLQAADLSVGTYFWRVRAIGSGERQGPYSPPRRLQLMRIRPLTLQQPSAGAVMSQQQAAAGVRFVWRDPNGAALYRFELAADKQFQTIIKRDVVKGGSYRVASVERGTYYWRVSLLKDRKETLRTEAPRRFQVRPALAEPVQLSPGGRETINITDKTFITFKWRNVKGASHYRAQLYRYTDQGEERLFNTVVPHARVLFDNWARFLPGDYRWQVRALTRQENRVVRRGDFAKAYFTVKVDNPTRKPIITTPKVNYVE